MWAWVRIPLLTHFFSFCFLMPIIFFIYFFSLFYLTNTKARFKIKKAVRRHGENNNFLTLKLFDFLYLLCLRTGTFPTCHRLDIKADASLRKIYVRLLYNLVPRLLPSPQEVLSTLYPRHSSKCHRVCYL